MAEKKNAPNDNFGAFLVLTVEILSPDSGMR
jgi:hypothetical protein